MLETFLNITIRVRLFSMFSSLISDYWTCFTLSCCKTQSYLSINLTWIIMWHKGRYVLRVLCRKIWSTSLAIAKLTLYKSLALRIKHKRLKRYLNKNDLFRLLYPTEYCIYTNVQNIYIRKTYIYNQTYISWPNPESQNYIKYFWCEQFFSSPTVSNEPAMDYAG